MYSVITVEWNPFVSIIFYVLAKHFENYLMLNISHMYIHIYTHGILELALCISSRPESNSSLSSTSLETTCPLPILFSLPNSQLFTSDNLVSMLLNCFQAPTPHISNSFSDFQILGSFLLEI